MTPNRHCGTKTTLFQFQAIQLAGGVSVGRSLTCDQALAGVTRGRGVDAVGRVGDLVPPVLDGDGVASRGVRDVGHCICPIPVVPDICLLGFSLRILQTGSQRIC